MTIFKKLKDNLKAFHFMSEEMKKKAIKIGPEHFWNISIEGRQVQAKTFELGLTYYLKDDFYDIVKE